MANNLHSDEMTSWLIMRRAIWERHRVIGLLASCMTLHDTPKSGIFPTLPRPRKRYTHFPLSLTVRTRGDREYMRELMLKAK